MRIKHLTLDLRRKSYVDVLFKSLCIMHHFVNHMLKVRFNQFGFYRLDDRQDPSDRFFLLIESWLTTEYKPMSLSNIFGTIL